MARYGLNARDVLERGAGARRHHGGQIDDGVGRFDIRVRYRERERSNMAAIGDLRVSNGAGISVPLSEVANITLAARPLRRSAMRKASA